MIRTRYISKMVDFIGFQLKNNTTLSVPGDVCWYLLSQVPVLSFIKT